MDPAGAQALAAKQQVPACRIIIITLSRASACAVGASARAPALAELP